LEEVGANGTTRILEAAFACIPEEQGRLLECDFGLDSADLFVDVAVGSEEVRGAVEIVVEEEDTEGLATEGCCGLLASAGLRRRRGRCLVVVEAEHLVREVADEQVGSAGAVVVAEVDAHGASGYAVFAEALRRPGPLLR
jgi:hypothetical protein